MSACPKFSIITVCLNETGSIRETCESICSQTSTAFEWIVMDGGSTDGTLDILNEYKERISCLISEPDKGIYHAMNKGISQASGEYLLFLNAGDSLFQSSVLERMAQAPQRDIIFGNIRIQRTDGSFSQTHYPETLSRHFLLKRMLPHQASFIRRRLFEKHGGYDESFKIAGDYDLFVRLLSLSHISYFRVPEVLAVFKEGGISNNPKYRFLRKIETHRVRKKYFKKYRYSWKALRQEIRQKLRRMRE